MSALPSIDPDRRWTPRFFSFGSVAVPYVSRDKAIQTISRSVVDGTQIRVAFCNANTMLLALRDRGYARLLGDFLILNDGVGMNLASRVLYGHRFDDNLNGTDFVPDLLRTCPVPLSIYLLGAREEVVAQAAARLAAEHPRHRIAGHRNGYVAPHEVDGVIADINAAKPDILLVAMGNPLQERFIEAHGGRIDARVLIGVGALFDFLAGRARRAPRLVRQLRLEWAFRLLREPLRLGRRYTVDLVVFLLSIALLRIERGPRDDAPPPRPRLRPDA